MLQSIKCVQPCAAGHCHEAQPHHGKITGTLLVPKESYNSMVVEAIQTVRVGQHVHSASTKVQD
jgi:hypothetical protein